MTAGLELMTDVTGLKPCPPLTDDDVKAMARGAQSGNISEARRIVESKGLTWLDWTGEKLPTELENPTDVHHHNQKKL